MRMNRIAVAAVLALALASGAACTNMSKTQQGAMSGTVLGGAAGAGIAAIAGGSAGWGAAVGAGAGALAGGILGYNEEQDRKYKRHKNR